MIPFIKNLRTRSLGIGTLLVVLFAFTASPARGQMGGVDINPGVRVGGSFMTVGGDDVPPDLSRRNGFLAGAFVQLDFAGPFALQPELLYTQKGFSRDQDFDGGTVTTTGKLDYIEIPVLAKFQIPVAGPFSPHLFAGPEVGLNVTAEQESEAGGESATEDISDQISSTEFGVVFGIGGDFGIGAGTITVDARYGLGLTSAYTDADESINNQGFMITAGFAF